MRQSNHSCPDVVIEKSADSNFFQQRTLLHAISIISVHLFCYRSSEDDKSYIGHIHIYSMPRFSIVDIYFNKTNADHTSKLGHHNVRPGKFLDEMQVLLKAELCRTTCVINKVWNGFAIFTAMFLRGLLFEFGNNEKSNMT